MSKRSVYSTITPLPPGVTRQTVLDFLHNHVEMIDLNPLVEERHPIKPPGKATAEEYHCIWYQLTDNIQYLPGGVYSGKVSYTACFHDLGNGVQTHVYAPMGLDIKNKWTVAGSLPGEPIQPQEIGQGIPLSGLYLREDTDMRCNVMMTSFVKKNLKKSHAALVARLVVKAQLYEANSLNDRLSEISSGSGSFYSSSKLSISHNPSVHSSYSSSAFLPQGSPSLVPLPLYHDQRNSSASGQYPRHSYEPSRHHQSEDGYTPRWSSQSFGSQGHQSDPEFQSGIHRQYSAQEYQEHNMYAQSTPAQKSSQPSELSSINSHDMAEALGNTAVKDIKGKTGPTMHPGPVSFAAELE